jgi:hypothetical protein
MATAYYSFKSPIFHHLVAPDMDQVAGRHGMFATPALWLSIPPVQPREAMRAWNTIHHTVLAFGSIVAFVLR